MKESCLYGVNHKYIYRLHINNFLYDTNYRDGDGVYTLDVIYYNQVVEKHDEQNGFIKTDNKVVYLYLLFSMNSYRH